MKFAFLEKVLQQIFQHLVNLAKILVNIAIKDLLFFDDLTPITAL